MELEYDGEQAMNSRSAWSGILEMAGVGDGEKHELFVQLEKIYYEQRRI